MLFGYWRLARTRKAVVRAIKPLISGSIDRCGPISGQTWQDPYIIGFLSMLITLVARSQDNRNLRSDSLALLQLDAWADLTAERDPGIGERILSLSASLDDAFVEGCRAASEFYDLWETTPNAKPAPYDEAFSIGSSTESNAVFSEYDSLGSARGFHIAGRAVIESWSQHFDVHLRY